MSCIEHGINHPDIFQQDKICLLTYEQRIVGGDLGVETLWSSRCSNQKHCEVRNFKLDSKLNLLKGLVRQNFAAGNVRMNQCKRSEHLSRRNPVSKCHFCQKMGHDEDEFTTTDIFVDANSPLSNVDGYNSLSFLTNNPELFGNVSDTAPAGQLRVFNFEILKQFYYCIILLYTIVFYTTFIHSRLTINT